MTGENSLRRTVQLVREGAAAGLHIGGQIYVSRAGEALVDLGVGESRPGVAMTTDSIMLWLSSSKPLTAVAAMQLVERGQLQLDTAVADYVPEFSVGGKGAITVRHLLTHTGGFRAVELGEPDTDWAEILDRIYATPLEKDWTPGQKAGYHIGSSWYVLGELVQRIDGRPLGDYVRDEIFQPLGMNDSWLGMPVDQYRAYGDRMALMQRTDKPEQPPHYWSSELGASRCAPGSNGQGPIRELGYFYEAMLSGGERQGARILQPETVRLMTGRQRQGMFDETFRHVMDWGLGFIVNSARYGIETVPYGYGRYASEVTFGHSGSQSSAAFADPRNDLVVTVALNGMPGERRHQTRIREILSAMYLDMDLASPA